jgi:hypothetical protein
MAAVPVDADTIAESAAKPKKASADGVQAEAHPIADQIAADKYRRAVETRAQGGLGIRFVRFVRGGE